MPDPRESVTEDLTTAAMEFARLIPGDGELSIEVSSDGLSVHVTRAQTIPTTAELEQVISVIETLPALTRETRRRRGVSLRAAEKESGVRMTTIMRCEQGHGLHVGSVVQLLRWIRRSETPDATPTQLQATPSLGVPDA